MASVITNIKAVAKPIVAALGALAAWLTNNFAVIPTQYQGYVTTFITIVTLLGIYAAPHGQLSLKSRSTRRSARRKVPAVTPPVGPASVPGKHES